MQFGCNEIKKRIKPSYSGERALCPFCQSELIGKCGEVYVWHWQHTQNSACDSWKEGETEWHRNWKAQFPEEWQEVIITKENEKHIADIQTKDGLIIEFQNSSISRATIREREAFYDDMIWVINAEKFKLKKFSLVQSKLNENKKRCAEKRLAYEKDWEEAEDSSDRYISNNQKQIWSQKGKIGNYDYEISKLQGVLAFKEEIAAEIIDSWKNDSYYYRFELSSFILSINELKTNWKSSFNYLSKLKKDLEESVKNLTTITQYATYYFDDRVYILAEYSSFSEKNYRLIIAIKKGTEQQLLPEIIEFSREDHFTSFKFQKDRYLFAIESKPIIESKKSHISELKDKVNAHDIEITKFHAKLTDALNIYSMSKIIETENKKRECENEVVRLTEVQNRIRENNELAAQKLQEDKNEFYREEALSLAEEETRIKQKYKGLFKYWWKHRRPSWDISENNVLLDLGDDYLYNIINDDLLKRTSKKDFIDKQKN